MEETREIEHDKNSCSPGSRNPVSGASETGKGTNRPKKQNNTHTHTNTGREKTTHTHTHTHTRWHHTFGARAYVLDFLFACCLISFWFGVFVFGFGILDLVYKTQEALFTRRNIKDCAGRPVLHIPRIGVSRLLLCNPTEVWRA